MEAALPADVLNGQRQTCLITGDGFVLGTVVLKDAVQVLEPRAEKHVPEEDGHFQRTFEDDARPAPQRDNLHDEAGQNVGKNVNRNSASTTPTKAAQVMSTFCTAGVACSSNHLSSLDSAGSASPSITISAACIKYR